MWFEQLTGFPEGTGPEVRERLSVSGRELISRETGKRWVCGELEVISLGELRNRVASASVPSGRLNVQEVVADVQRLHLDGANAHALFQVASQFNLLEMVSPAVSPERGVDIYEKDFTQGPACAIAAGAGTIFRNYFAPTHGQIGQSETNQIDCLSGIGELLGNKAGRLWEMRNGYALASAGGLDEITLKLEGAGPDGRDQLRAALQVGIQWGTQVTFEGSKHLVSQVFCSALPVAYCRHPRERWRSFAVLVLEAAYEATLCAAALNAAENGNNRVFLTLLGGGAFGNEPDWILGAIRRALGLHRETALDVRFVSYGSPNPRIRTLLT